MQADCAICAHHDGLQKQTGMCGYFGNVAATGALLAEKTEEEIADFTQFFASLAAVERDIPQCC